MLTYASDSCLIGYMPNLDTQNLLILILIRFTDLILILID